MKIDLVSYTDLAVAVLAANTCYNKESDSVVIDADEGLQFKIGKGDKLRLTSCVKNGHTSVLEHLVYTFVIDGISRGCLQQLVRHRIASYTVKSTRYTLGELTDVSVNDLGEYLVKTGNEVIDAENETTLSILRTALLDNADITNDEAKYMLPESFKTKLVMTINARSLLNFFKLRMSKKAHAEIRKLASSMYNELPLNHKFIFNSESSH